MVTVHGSYVQFRFFRPSARFVQLVGGVEGGKAEQLQMVRTADGGWLAALRLPGGSYCFRSLADGRWCFGLANLRIEHGPFVA